MTDCCWFHCNIAFLSVRFCAVVLGLARWPSDDVAGRLVLCFLLLCGRLLSTTINCGRTDWMRVCAECGRDYISNRAQTPLARLAGCCRGTSLRRFMLARSGSPATAACHCFVFLISGPTDQLTNAHCVPAGCPMSSICVVIIRCPL